MADDVTFLEGVLLPIDIRLRRTAAEGQVVQPLELEVDKGVIEIEFHGSVKAHQGDRVRFTQVGDYVSGRPFRQALEDVTDPSRSTYAAVHTSFEEARLYLSRLFFAHKT